MACNKRVLIGFPQGICYDSLLFFFALPLGVLIYVARTQIKGSSEEDKKSPKTYVRTLSNGPLKKIGSHCKQKSPTWRNRFSNSSLVLR